MDPTESSQSQGEPPPAPGEPDDLPDLLKIPPVAKAGWLRVLLAFLGVICMGLGVAGWLVPVVTGIPFYILGLVLLGMAHPPLGHWINRKERGLSPRVRWLLRPRLRHERKLAERAAQAPRVEEGEGEPRG